MSIYVYYGRLIFTFTKNIKKAHLPEVVYGPIKYSYKKFDQIVQRFF